MTGYVGIPVVARGRTREGVDCWGLVRLVYAAEFGIDLPSYADRYVTAAERAELDRLSASERAAAWSRTMSPQQYDLMLFRRGEYANHVGLWLPGGMMLHAHRANSTIERQDRWGARLVGIYRHEARP